MELPSPLPVSARAGSERTPHLSEVPKPFPNLPNSLLGCVGNTPLVRLENLTTRKDVTVLAKLEMQNPGGSIKDRTALSLIDDGYERGILTANSRVVESSSGNLAIGLAQACCKFGLKLTVVVDSRTNPNVTRIVKVFGGDIEVVRETREDEGLLDARLRRVREIVEADPEAVWLNQYSNPANPRAHKNTMGEIIEETGGEFDRVYLATSTCGTLAGCQETLEAAYLFPRIVAVDAEGSSIFQSDKEASNAKRHIPGHGSSRKSDFLEPGHYDEVSLVSDIDCVSGCRHLLRREGILAGGSSGGVVTSFLRDVEALPTGSTAVLILCDRGERYLETIYDDDWVRTRLGEAAF